MSTPRRHALAVSTHAQHTQQLCKYKRAALCFCFCYTTAKGVRRCWNNTTPYKNDSVCAACLHVHHTTPQRIFGRSTHVRRVCSYAAISACVSDALNWRRYVLLPVFPGIVAGACVRRVCVCVCVCANVRMPRTPG